MTLRRLPNPATEASIELNTIQILSLWRNPSPALQRELGIRVRRDDLEMSVHLRVEYHADPRWQGFKLSIIRYKKGGGLAQEVIQRGTTAEGLALMQRLYQIAQPDLPLPQLSSAGS